VRIVCATNRHLWESVAAGQFREDLYYRIACLAVRLPPLRERLDDIKLLAPALLSPICRASARQLSLTDGAIERLKQYQYPGNVRELRNILYIAATQSGNGKIDSTLIDDVFRQLSRNGSQPVDTMGVAAPGRQKDQMTSETSRKSHVSASTLQDVEARHIAELLERFRNNRRKVAEHLHISERTLYRKLKRYHIN
jgi:DNA-binding NtrC family response regulator